MCACMGLEIANHRRSPCILFQTDFSRIRFVIFTTQKLSSVSKKSRQTFKISQVIKALLITENSNCYLFILALYLV